MAIGIYKLTFTNGMFYIGRSSNIARRSTEHLNQLKNHTHSNTKMLYAFTKYGEPRLDILEYTDNNSLIYKEQEYLKAHFNNELNINIISVSEGFGSGIDCPNSKYSKSSILLIFRSLYNSINSYSSISLKLGVPKTLVENIAKQGRHIWLLDKYPYLYNKMLKNNNTRLRGYNNSIYRVMSPSNKEYEFSNIKEFALEHNISESGLQRVLRNELIYTSGGWRLPCTTTKNSFFIKNKLTNEVVKVENISDFCRKNFPEIDFNSARCGINRLKSNKAKSYKNWIKYECS